MKPHRKRRLTFILFIVLGLGATTALVLFSLSSNINLFYQPLDIAQGKAPTNVLIRVGGLVVPGSVQRSDEDLNSRFQLTDNAECVWVSFNGILPDLFREGQGIVSLGKLQENGEFVASEVLAKHDENYMSKEVADAVKNAEAEAKARDKKEDLCSPK
ncbi:MAG: cytochrome c maturation protein CcmE [Gammaproteobacteria bacterium]|nr:cytochrome c maturation protein CcmE [Gammaproteobacteria bacterium]MDH5630426.1 cytochrome c maturation protein CcmE [Gammaproteobacteria bacterium]